MKKVYAAPKVQELGSLHELTLAAADGSLTDQDFPANTPKGKLTFS